MSNIMFSIIVPVYNGQQYISRCLDSLVVQENTMYSLEVIVINDGSTDLTKDIIKKYQNKYNFIKLINKSNGGVSSARNMGLEYAKGKFILFCDSDDAFPENLLLKAYSLLNEKEYDCIIFGRKDYSSGKVIATHNVHDKDIMLQCSGKEYICDYFLKGKSAFSVVNKIYKKYLIDHFAIKFNEKLKFSEDVLFNLLYLINCNSFYEMFSCHYHRFCNEGSSIYNKYNNRFELLIEFLPILINSFKPKNDEDNVFISHVYYSLMFMCADNSIIQLLEKRDGNTFRDRMKTIKKILSYEDVKIAVVHTECRGWKNILKKTLYKQRNVFVIYLIFGTFTRIKRKLVEELNY